MQSSGLPKFERSERTHPVKTASKVRKESGCRSGEALRFPIPRQQFVDPSDRMVGQLGEHVGEPGARIDVVELGGLCRPVNYAERSRFPHDSH